jgi:SAM-dependent methyltransferase
VPPREPSVEEIRDFWQEHPVGDSQIGRRATLYDYFREFDNLRESPDVEPYAFSNRVHDYEGSAGKAVLDYGCGNGYVLSHYARHGAAVYGVDLTQKAVDLARARFDLLGLDGTFVRNDGSEVPFEDGFFDVACSMGVLHHIPEPAPVVAELHRALRPGGRLIAMVYNRRSYRHRVGYRLRRSRGETLEERVTRNDGTDNPYGRVYDQEDLRGLLAGFEEHRFLVNKLSYGELALWFPVAERMLARAVPRRAVDRLARRWGWNLYCIARKPAG